MQALPTVDLVGNQLLDLCHLQDECWVSPERFFTDMEQLLEGLDDIGQIENLVIADMVLHHVAEYKENVITGTGLGANSWRLIGNYYYIPVPRTRLIVALEAPESFREALYLLAEPTNVGEVQYLDVPSISYIGNSFVATKTISPADVWAKRISTTKRKDEMKSVHQHFNIKPFNETQALYKCMPNATYLLQDCYFGTQQIGGVPIIRGNKTLLVMAGETVLKRLLSLQEK